MKVLSRYVFVFLLSVALNPCGAWAQSGQSDIQVDVAPEDPNARGFTKEELVALMNSAHEALEGHEAHEDHSSHEAHCPNCGHHHGHEAHEHKHGISLAALFSKEQWKEKFNFKQTLLNALRWYQVKATNKEIQVHVANIITMLLASHYSEGVLGAKMASMGLASDHILLQIMGPLLGGAIFVPGLDPLCIALGFVYKRMPHMMGRLMYVPRVIILTGAGLFYKYLGIKSLFQNLFDREDALSRLQRLINDPDGNSEIFKMDDRVHFEVTKNGKPLLTLEGYLDESKIFWDRLRLSESLRDPSLRDYLMSEIKPLNWVLRQSLLDVLKRIEDPKSVGRLAYVDSARASGGELDVVISTRGMAAVAKPKFTGVTNCLFKLFMATSR